MNVDSVRPQFALADILNLISLSSWYIFTINSKKNLQVKNFKSKFV